MKSCYKLTTLYNLVHMAVYDNVCTHFDRDDYFASFSTLGSCVAWVEI